MKKLMTMILIIMATLILIPEITSAQPILQQDFNRQVEMEILKFIVSQKWWDNDKIVQQLNLSEKQIEELNDIYINYKKKVIQLKAIVEERRFDLSILIEQKDIEVEKVEEAVDLLMEAVTELEKYEIMTRVKVLDVLSPEQREKLIEMAKNIIRERLKNMRESDL